MSEPDPSNEDDWHVWQQSGLVPFGLVSRWLDQLDDEDMPLATRRHLKRLLERFDPNPFKATADDKGRMG